MRTSPAIPSNSPRWREGRCQHIVFCGVHFMAESADILTRDDQSVTLPTFAGCSMADMADVGDVLEAWMDLLEHHDLKDPASRSDPEASAGTERAIRSCDLHEQN